MKSLSKSRYTLFRQCPKALWLRIYKPDVATEDKALEARFEEGNVVGDLAMGYLGPFEEVTIKNPDGSLDLSEMCRRTRDCMARGVENIAEASFSWDGNYCAVDILHKTAGGWAIYEVKSSSGTVDQPDDDPEYVKYARDIAYQKYVLEQCGVKVTGTYLVRIDKEYVRGNQLDIRGLFYTADLAELVQQEYQVVPQMIAAAKRTLDGPEPDIDLGLHCHDPYNCAFWDSAPGICRSHRCSMSMAARAAEGSLSARSWITTRTESSHLETCGTKISAPSRTCRSNVCWKTATISILRASRHSWTD